MGWLSNLFDPSTWFYWTVAGKGARDGRRGIPLEDQVRQVGLYKGDVDAITKLLDTLKGSDPSIKTTQDVSGQLTDDHEKAITSLTDLMAERGIPVDKLDRDNRIKLVHLLTDILSELRDENKTGGKPPRLSFFEAEMLNITEEKISRLIERWDKKKQPLEGKAKNVRHHLAHLLSEYKRIHQLHKEKGFRQPHRISWWMYLPIMAILGLLEFPFNLTAFKILRAPPNELIIMAAAPSIAIPLLAHFLGTKIKQWPTTGEPNWRTVLIAIVAITALLVGLLAIGLLRADYIAYIRKTHQDYWQAALLMGINLLFLSAATITSYFAHDSDRGLERVVKEKNRLRPRLDREWNAWSKTASKFDSYRGATLARIQQLRDDTRARMDEYRQFNSRFQTNSSIPPHFQDEITDDFFIPRDLGAEIDKAPPSLDEVLKEIEGEGGKS